MTQTRLVDINVWLALLDEDHVHHERAKRWMHTVGVGQAAFCRVAQLSLLRLLSNPAAMRGVIRSPAQVWNSVRALLGDERVGDTPEPPGVLAVMHAITKNETALSGSSWTDAYLAAFAIAGEYALATFDKRIAKRYPVQAEIVA